MLSVCLGLPLLPRLKTGGKVRMIQHVSLLLSGCRGSRVRSCPNACFIGMKFPTTPPPRRKHLTGIQNAVLLPDSYPLTKSKSHESQLAKGDNGEIPTGEKGSGKRSRLPTEPGPDTDYTSPILTSPIKSPPYNNAGTDSDDNSYKCEWSIPPSDVFDLPDCFPAATSLQVPKSPRTPTSVVRNMTHQINHRFTKKFKMMATCGYCTKPIYFGTGLRCKECKYTCHRECEDRVAPSCGLPPELLNEFKKLSCDNCVFPSPNPGRSSNTKNIINSITRIRKKSHPQPAINIPPFPVSDEKRTCVCLLRKRKFLNKKEKYVHKGEVIS
jgi:kinase suppressor of Ras 2